MWCEFCDCTTCAVETTIRLTRDGHEILVQYCSQCLRKSETEYIKGPTVQFRIEKPKGN